ncbi:hypothetical protein FNH22_13585 [Fulvivirga sp. M361]|uniref:hypothetical protein n=1 Tax=Fulvivirga sp. M361 TaxID=2594266 RepID=UPI00117B6E1F|nr:hypothetical protein [Fulvivirga sp. M361]TRX58376.1 hypothetical protein FNH22_13585 [Fulvivirga sp. M361]
MNKSLIYKGIEFVRISDLPEDQQTQIRNIVSADLVIKIKTDTELFSDCLLYKDYKHWFESIYTRMSPAEEEPSSKKPRKIGLLARLIHRLLPNT